MQLDYHHLTHIQAAIESLVAQGLEAGASYTVRVSPYEDITVTFTAARPEGPLNGPVPVTTADNTVKAKRAIKASDEAQS